MSATKTSRLNIRVAPADAALLRRAAELLGESISEFLVESARDRAERLVADRTRFVLTDEQWSAFCAALDRPAEVRPELNVRGRRREQDRDVGYHALAAAAISPADATTRARRGQPRYPIPAVLLARLAVDTRDPLNSQLLFEDPRKSLE